MYEKRKLSKVRGRIYLVEFNPHTAKGLSPLFTFSNGFINGEIDTDDSRRGEYQQTGEGIHDNSILGRKRDEEDETGSIDWSGGGLRIWRKECGGDKIIDTFSAITFK